MRDPKEAVNLNNAANDYIDECRDLKLFYKDYVGEQLLNPFINYTNMNKVYPIQVIDLRFQVDHKNPQKVELFEEYR